MNREKRQSVMTNSYETVQLTNQSSVPQSLNGPWLFAYQPPSHSPSETPPDDAQYMVTAEVPGFWDDQFNDNAPPPWWNEACFNPDYAPLHFVKTQGSDTHQASPDASLPYLLGRGYYRRRFAVSKECLKLAWRLFVEFVFLDGQVWLNGNLLASRRGYAAPLSLWLPSDYLSEGVNELIVAVNNLDDRQGGLRLRGFKGRGAGIGPLYLTGFAGGKITGLQTSLTPDLNRIELDTELELAPGAEPPADNRLTWRILGTEGEALLSGRQKNLQPGRIKWQADRGQLTLWSPKQARLYDLELIWNGDGREIDRQRHRIGLRRLDSKGLKLQLNGHPLFLRGATEHCYFPVTCTPPPDRVYYRQAIARLKEIGFNWLRCHTWVPPEEYLQAADELGMLIQVELPPGLNEKEWEEIVRRCRRHPSVGFYCGGNEELCDSTAISFWGRLRETVRSLAPGTLFMPQEAMRGIEYYWHENCFDEGTLSEKPFRHHPERLREITEIADVFGQYSWGYLSYLSLQGEWSELEQRYTVYQRPLLSHEIGIFDSYLDPDLRERYAGTRIGTDLYDRALEQLTAAGVAERWKLYYRNSCRWQAALRKHVIEKARLCGRVNGYDYLGGIHTHWHRSGYGCGCLNEFYEFKEGDKAEDFLAFNGESVLLLDHRDQRCHQAGELFAPDVYLAWYGDRPLTDDRLVCTIVNEKGEVVLRKTMDCEKVDVGRLVRLANLDFRWPELTTATTLRLQVELENAAVRNAWKFWVFPSEAEHWPADVQVVEELNHSVIDFLDRGGDVVLLGYRPLPTRHTSFQINVAGRAAAHTATVVAGHPALNDFPHQGWCDWQFKSLLTNGRAVQLQDLTDNFEPIVEMAGSYKQPGREAAMFEACVGRGRLLTVAFNPDAEGPAAQYLRSCLGRYVGSADFNPRMRITPAILKKLAESRAPDETEEAAPATDMAFDINLRRSKTNAKEQS